jgi:hypothetical protein
VFVGTLSARFSSCRTQDPEPTPPPSLPFTSPMFSLILTLSLIQFPRF